MSSVLNELFTTSGFRAMSEGRDYRTVSMVFSFAAGFIDRIIGFVEEPLNMMRFHTMYSDLIVFSQDARAVK